MSFDRDLRAKEKAKYDDRFDEMERDARLWIEETIGHEVNPGNDLCDSLKDGINLCELANSITPNSTRYKSSKMPFIQMENIAAFLRFASSLGIPAHDLFQTIDLFERKNVFQVIQSIHTFSRYASKKTGGRFLGPKMSTATSREFTDAQRDEFRNSVNTYQYGRVNGSTNTLRAARRDPAGNFH